jgi:phosphatidylglycerol:prolipoprotein diacylglycerol transferase
MARDESTSPTIGAVLAVIPYVTFPQIELGPLHLRTFGLMVGLGVLVGAWLAARHSEQYGISRDDTYRLATKLVIAGIIGARITWDITHFDQIDSPLDLIAVWQGGLQFSGGFLGALIVGFPTFRRWTRVLRWRVLDGYAYGLTAGLAIGRIGCISVGEHFGSQSSFLLAVRWDGGVPPNTREQTLGAVRIVDGMTFHNTAIYELLFLAVLFGVLSLIDRRRPTAGVLMGVFCLYYGIARGLTDLLRVNDNTILGLTGAQYFCIALIPAGVWILTRVRRVNAALQAEADAFAAADQAATADSDDAGAESAEPAVEAAAAPADDTLADT